MMIIDIRKLNAQKKYSGHLEFSYDAPQELLDIPFVKFVSPVAVSFDYELYEDDSMDIRGTVSYQLAGQCSRCLKDAKQTVEGEIDAYFQPVKDCEDYSYSNGVIHLQKAVDEAIMASLPFTLSCGEDCEGISFKQ